MVKNLVFPAAILFSITVKPQACGNLDLESGNFGGWTITSGYNTNTTLMSGCCTTPGSATATIVTTPLSDPYLGVLPNSPFGGTKVGKLGNNIGSVWATRAEYTFVVTGNTFEYAMAPFAFNPSNHPCVDQNYNSVRLKDATSTVFYTNQLVPSGTTGTCSPGSGVYTFSVSQTAFGCWSTYSVNVGAYIGQTISVEVTSAACTGGGHWAYCYFDAVCSAITPTMLPCGIMGVSEKTVSNEFAIYPNPAKDILNISFAGNSQHAEFIIYDILGKIVLKQNEFSETTSINIRQLNNGAYFYKFTNGETLKTGKFIKE